MFNFLNNLNQNLYKRYLDIENAYRTYSGSIYVSMQLYLESLFKYITDNLDEDFYLDKRETLGSLLGNEVFKNTLESDFEVDNLSNISSINSKANTYKHEELVDFNQKEIIDYIRCIYELSVKVNNYFSDICKDMFDEKYYLNIINNTDDILSDAYNDFKNSTEKEIEKKDIEIKEQIKEKEIIKLKYEKALQERDATNKENEKLKTLQTDYNKKENEIADLKKKRADYELQVADNLNSEIKKIKNDLGQEIKKLSEESLKLKKDIKLITEKNVDEYNTKINKFKVLLEDKDSELDKLKEQIQKLKEKKENILPVSKYTALKVIRENTRFVSYSNSYIDEDNNYIIYNLNNINSSKSKYRSFYAILHNILYRGKIIKKSEYLTNLNLSEREYSLIIRLQMTILALIRNDIIKDDEWKINLLGEELELLKYAVNDIFNRIESYTSLARIDYDKPFLDLKNSEEVKEDYSNISFGSYDINPNIYSIENMYSEKTTSKVWIDDKIQYKIDDSDSIVLSQILEELFEFKIFKEGQLPILINALNGHNTLGILPTGGGKSLVFQFCTFMQPKLSLIIAPINSLIKDQVYKLTDIFDISKVSNITGGAQNRQQEIGKFENMESIFNFVSPERFQSNLFRNILIRHDDKEAIGLVVLDEVHCLSEWGHDFRISYLMLSHTINCYCKNIQYLGLTATASINVVKDLRIELHINNPKDIVFAKKLKRKNLNFKIIELNDKNDMDDYLYSLIINNYNEGNDKDISLNGNKTNSMIVFMKIKKDTENNYRKYNSIFESEVERFNGDYKLSQDAFMNNEKSLLFATKAFGMGIDKPNVRNTIHFGIPSSREGFYQEAGRAGRDDKGADCLLLTYKIPNQFVEYVDEFIRQDTTVKELNNLNKIIAWKTDVSTNFYFFLSGIEDPQIESINAYNLYLDYSKRNQNLLITDCSNESEGNEKERYLYILHKIGAIYNWSVRYEREGIYYDIELNNNYDDIEHLKFSAEKYILPYIPDPEYINKIKSINSINELKDLLLIVRKWYFATFVKTRREQLANMIAFVNSYKNKNNSEGIQNELEKFFDISSLIDKAEEGYSLTFEDESIEDVLEAASLLEDDKLNDRRIEMERLVESISNNKIDLYISLINLRLNIFDSRNGKERLLFALDSMNEVEKIEVFQNVDYIYDILNKKQKIELLYALFEYDKKKFNNVLLENIAIDYIASLFLIKSINNQLVSIV